MSRLFGTDGVRGVANKDLTPKLAFRLARVCGYILSKNNTCRNPYFIVGMDPRLSSDMLEHAVVAGLCSAGVSAYKAGVVPTPVISFLTSRTDACGGVMISASHNPFYDNGIKFFNHNGFKLEDSQEDEIERLLPEHDNEVPFPEGQFLGKVLKEDFTSIYTDFVKNITGGNNSLKGLKVVVDCANGASYKLIPMVLRELGADVITLNISPDGVNINNKCGSTHPEEIKRVVLSEKAHAGFAFDGDADRVIAVDGNGNIVDGDQLMALISFYLKDRNMLKNNILVSTVMSNLGFQKALEKNDIKLLRTKVGDRYVLEEMIKSGGILGGEQSGHIIFLDYNNTGDGLITALTVLKVMIDTGESLYNLSSVIKKYPQILINITVSDREKFLHDNYLKDFILKEEERLGDMGRILVRPSGTEPIVRVMVEASDEKVMNMVAEKIASEIRISYGQ